MIIGPLTVVYPGVEVLEGDRVNVLSSSGAFPELCCATLRKNVKKLSQKKSDSGPLYIFKQNRAICIAYAVPRCLIESQLFDSLL